MPKLKKIALIRKMRGHHLTKCRLLQKQLKESQSQSQPHEESQSSEIEKEPQLQITETTNDPLKLETVVNPMLIVLQPQEIKDFLDSIGNEKQIQKDVQSNEYLKILPREDQSILPKENSATEEEKDKNKQVVDEISGRRIIDIDWFFLQLQKISSHDFTTCGMQYLKLVGETRVGLRSQFTVKCLMCKEKFSFYNICQNGTDINTAAVSSAVATGIGYSQLIEILKAFDLPLLSESVYQKRLKTILKKTGASQAACHSRNINNI